MGYKGEDLDLRTPHLWSAPSEPLDSVVREGPAVSDSGPSPSARASGGRSEPIWVDETVMACCNRAYELAAAHRAAEVRLEHLLNAMTLVEAAARILEQRGIGVTDLRRESGAMLAGELPIATSAGQEAPLRSPELEQALRLAAEHAYPRRTPVTTDELLLALLDMKREWRSIHLLHRYSANWTRREAVEPPSAGPAGPRARVRVAAGSDYSGPTPPDVARADENRHGGWPEDRLTTLEHSIETRLGDLARTGSLLADRLQALEQALEAVRGESQTMPAAISEHLQSLESWPRKFDDVERLLSLLLDRVAGLERHIERPPPQAAGDLAMIGERLGALERALASLPVVNFDFGALEGRLRGIAAQADETGRAVAEVAHRLEAVGDPLGAPFSQPFSTLDSALKELVGEIRAQQAQGERLLKEITDRHQTLAGVIEGQGDAVASKVATPLAERLSRLAALLEQRQAESSAAIGRLAERLEEQITDRVQALASVIDAQSEGIAAKVASPIAGQLASLAAALEQRQADSGSAIRELAERVGAIGKSLAAGSQQTAELQTAHTRVLTGLQEAMLQVNGNQKTIATALDQWRLETTRDFRDISNRLDALHRLVAEQEERRGRWRGWLSRSGDASAANQGSPAGSALAAKPPLDAGASTPLQAGFKPWLQQAIEFVRSRRAK
jgi:hypothetical protein